MLLVIYTEVHQAGFSWPVSYLPSTPFDCTINCCYKDRKKHLLAHSISGQRPQQGNINPSPLHQAQKQCSWLSFFMHDSLVFLLNKPLLQTASPTLHNKVNTSPQRLRYETQNSPLGGESVRDRRRQVSRDLANSCLPSGEWWGSLLFPKLPVAAVTNLKVTSFPRDYLKRKGIFIIMKSLLSYSLLFPN